MSPGGVTFDKMPLEEMSFISMFSNVSFSVMLFDIMLCYVGVMYIVFSPLSETTVVVRIFYCDQ